MGEVSRRAKIEAMLAEEPHDTFLRYSLAMELQKEGAWDDSLRCFHDLMRDRAAPCSILLHGRQTVGAEAARGGGACRAARRDRASSLAGQSACRGGDGRVLNGGGGGGFGGGRLIAATSGQEAGCSYAYVAVFTRVAWTSVCLPSHDQEPARDAVATNLLHLPAESEPA